MSSGEQQPAPDTLRSLVTSLTAGDSEAEPIPDGETWDELMARMHVAGRINRITDETYDYFLDVLPPRWMSGNHFAFAEGQDPLQLFWVRGGETAQSGDYFTRRMTDDEIATFCRLARIPRDYGSYSGDEF